MAEALESQATAAPESEASAADSRAASQMPPELKAKLTSLSDSFRNLGYTEHLAHLVDLCVYMDKRQLNFSAQMFVLDQHIYSLDEIVTKSQALIKAAKSGTRLEFSVQCLEDFVEACKECHDVYDYPADSASVEADSKTATPPDSDKAIAKDPVICESTGSSQRFTNSIDNGGGGSSSNRASACTDPGYFSKGNSHPVPKPRRNSAVSTERGAGLCIAGGSSQGTPAGGTMPQQGKPRRKESTSSSGGGSNSGVRKSSSFLQMLLYPEVTKREAAVKKKKKKEQAKV